MSISAIITLAAALMRLLTQLAGWARDSQLREAGRLEAENDALGQMLAAERQVHEAEIEELSRPIVHDADGFIVDDGFRRD